MNAFRSESPTSELSAIRALFLAPLIEELTARGLDIAEFLGRHNLRTCDPTRPYEFVSLRGYVSLAEDMAQQLDRPFLGLELGQNFGLAAMGPLWAVLRLADTLREALTTLTHMHSAWQTCTTLKMVRGEAATVLHYAIDDPTIAAHCQDAEFSLASLCTTIRQLTSESWRPLGIQFRHDVENRRERLSGFFRAKVEGDGAANLMFIENEVLDRSLDWSVGPQGRTLRASFEQHLRALLGEQLPDRKTCAEHVRILIGRRLGRDTVDIESLASEMNMSGRSLRRRLTREGTSFRRILREQRYSEMTTVLAHGGAPLTSLADRLSYSEASVLSRAFKTWTGVSPRQYAKAQR